MRVDEIRKEMVLSTPIEDVWEALTTPERLAQWFGDTAEVDLRSGGRARFGWSESNDLVDAIIEVVDRPHRFSFRWESMRDTPVEQASTLVEFTLTVVGDGTRLTLVESGFRDLPDEVYEERFAENSSGWASELVDLSQHLARADVG